MLPLRLMRCLYRSNVGSASRLLTSKPVKTPEQIEAEARKYAKRKELHIALINIDKTVTHTTLEDATKLSARRDLKLIKISDWDRKRDSPVYQLMTATQYREEALSLKKSKKSEEKKGPYKSEKLVALNSQIGAHDLESKIQKIMGWLAKNHEIRITITASKEPDLAEKVFKKIESSVGTLGRILQKRVADSVIKFQLIPPKQPKTTQSDDKTET